MIIKFKRVTKDDNKTAYLTNLSVLNYEKLNLKNK